MARGRRHSRLSHGLAPALTRGVTDAGAAASPATTFAISFSSSLFVLANSRVAYFCMEFGLDDRMSSYAGGLGILAGDIMKGAKDLDIPMVGVGIRWKQGYGRQRIGPDGRPEAVFVDQPPDPSLENTGVEVTVTIAGAAVRVKVWKSTAFGTVPVYLLDTDLPGNAHAGVTARLYGGTQEDRIAQEIVLGIGGVRALRELHVPVDVYHFNEGHALLAAFELIREKQEKGMTYGDALAIVRGHVVFTTHTPVVEGNETHPVERLRAMGAAEALSDEQLMALGGSPFNMTVGALRLSRAANAVSQLHAETARRMWAGVAGASEIQGITNGIHVPTWVDPAMITASEGEADVWTPHVVNKRALADMVRKRTGAGLDPERLVVGFARRAVAYKRPPLVFSDEARVAPLLESGRLQLVFSGKAHPQDDAGQQLVATLVEMTRKYPAGVFFLEDYSMAVGAAMTRGCDVWLNNPRRPKEASGTSGMKAAMNGVLNASVLDGWWPEACQDGVNGWQIGGGLEASDEAAQDAHDAADLYRVLLDQIVPTYYDDPSCWQAMMRASITSTLTQFGTERMLREYAARMYAV